MRETTGSEPLGAAGDAAGATTGSSGSRGRSPILRCMPLDRYDACGLRSMRRMIIISLHMMIMGRGRDLVTAAGSLGTSSAAVSLVIASANPLSGADSSTGSADRLTTGNSGLAVAGSDSPHRLNNRFSAAGRARCFCTQGRIN